MNIVMAEWILELKQTNWIEETKFEGRLGVVGVVID